MKIFDIRCGCHFVYLLPDQTKQISVIVPRRLVQEEDIPIRNDVQPNRVIKKKSQGYAKRPCNKHESNKCKMRKSHTANKQTTNKQTTSNK